MDFDLAFKAVKSRAAELRLAEKEVVQAAGISPIAWWRARKGKVGMDARVKALKRVEDELDRREIKV